MTLSANFPHKLALMLVALQSDKLPLCRLLDDPAEKLLIGTLICYSDSKDCRTPITLSRKTLGEKSRVKRSTLFAKLKSLRDKGIIEGGVGEAAIRFTAQAVTLMQIDCDKSSRPAPQADRGFFKVGRFHFPQPLVTLLNRGLSNQQLCGLLAEAKKAGVAVQDVLKKYADVLARYHGLPLYLVARDILRQPDKYRTASITPPAPLDQAAQAVLAVAANHGHSLLLPGEKLQRQGSGWVFSRPSVRGGAPTVVTTDTVALLQQRMRELVKRHGRLQLTLAGTPATWSGASHQQQPQLQLADGSQRTCSWATLYQQLPPAARCWQQATSQDHRTLHGRLFSVNGVRYLVDLVSNGVAALRILSGTSAGRVMSVAVDKLAAPEVIWQPQG